VSRSQVSPPNADEHVLVVHPESVNSTLPSGEELPPSAMHVAEYRPGSRYVASLLSCDTTWVALHVPSAYSCPTAEGVSRFRHWSWVS
jgi:hypothetical protein